MHNLIKNGAVIEDDDWLLLPLQPASADADSAPESVVVPEDKVIVPLSVWQAQRDALSQRPQIGVWLTGNQRPHVLRDDLDRLAVIAIEFPIFTDGRGYSSAYTLRAHYGYRGELRAFGDVLRDQLFYMQRVGFDAFAVRPDRDAHDALRGLSVFSGSYQQSWDEKLPLFRRVDRQAGVVR